MMAAGRAAEVGARVILLEKKERTGKKILISGKARCNLTNTRDLDDFVTMYGPNGRFLYRAFRHYFRDDLLEFLGRYGVETKCERGGRIFPVSDDAGDIVRCLERYMADYGVEVRTGDRVTGMRVEAGSITGVRASRRTHPTAATILATGGASYPQTGSSGDGFHLASAAGHNMVRLRPALVPLVVEETDLAASMQGVSLHNVRLTAYQCTADEINLSRAPRGDWGRGTGGKRPPRPVIESRLGEMMMTHFGIGGPATLLMSLSVVDALELGPVIVSIDLKPALDDKQLRLRLQRDFDHYSKRSYRNILKGLLPVKMVDPFVEITGIPADKPGSRMVATERERLLRSLKSLRFNIKGSLPMDSAIVTAGGVSLDEIDPRTMSSRLVNGLYFCGEVMDIDADTGGYNLQAAFSTGYVAGEQAALKSLAV